MGDNASKDSDGGSRLTFIRGVDLPCVVLLLVAAACSQEAYDQLLHHWDYDKNAPLNIQQAGAGRCNDL